MSSQERFGQPKKDPDLSPAMSTQTAHILKLPSKILLQVYKQIKCPRVQIAVALSCKEWAEIANLQPMNSDCTHRFGGPCQARDLLRGLKSWMPPNLQLCETCWKYLPRQRVWLDKNGTKITELKLVDWMWALKDWLGGGKICPTCHVSTRQPGMYEMKLWLQCRGQGFDQGIMMPREYSTVLGRDGRGQVSPPKDDTQLSDIIDYAQLCSTVERDQALAAMDCRRYSSLIDGDEPSPAIIDDRHSSAKETGQIPSTINCGQYSPSIDGGEPSPEMCNNQLSSAMNDIQGPSTSHGGRHSPSIDGGGLIPRWTAVNSIRRWTALQRCELLQKTSEDSSSTGAD